MFQFLLPIFMIAASIGIYFGFIDPTYNEAQALKEKNTALNVAVNNANQVTESRNKLVAKINSFPVDDMARLLKLLPDNIDNIRLIMEVDRIALKYGMSLRDVKVSGSGLPQDGGTLSSPAIASSGVIGGTPKDYDNVKLSFSVFSNYQTIKQFLGELEENLRITDIEKLSFSTRENTRGQDVYQFNVSLNTYWLK